MNISRLLIPFLGAALALAACDRAGTERWTTTENTNVPIDWDKVNEAYKSAEGPEDFEKRVNEIYEGKEVISVSVQDLDDKTQVVTGFFDNNTSGSIDEGEKVFTIRREITGEGAAQYQTSGYGASYGYYHSPFMSVMSGMIVGNMISHALMPGYAPRYTTPYTTSMTRVSNLHATRSSYRAANPTRFNKPKMSGSGRSYNSGAGRIRSSGGTRFGVRKRNRKLVRLDA